jgi:uridine kinase
VILVGLAGGSGSGKTTLADALVAALPAGQVVVIAHDAYYRDLAHLAQPERAGHNFDEPAALESELLIAQLADLRAGRAVEIPRYDFATHTRLRATTRLSPAPIVVVEGILVLAIPDLRAMFDVTVFVAASEATRLARRARRDVQQRGRTLASVMAQMNAVTLPMHRLHVEPSRQGVDLEVSGEDGASPVDTVIARVLGQQAHDSRR